MGWSNLDGYTRKYGPVFLSGFIFTIIISDILFPERVVITWQLISLIVLLVVVPFIPLIKTIRYGDWEAEIESLLVQAERTIENPESEPKEDDGELVEDDPEITGEDVSDFRRLANADARSRKFRSRVNAYLSDDVKVALSDLRMELDRTLMALAEQHDIENSDFGIRTKDLLQEQVLTQEEIEDVESIYDITTRAIHGKEVSESNARRIIDLGETVLQRLYSKLDEDISTDVDEPPVDLNSGS